MWSSLFYLVFVIQAKDALGWSKKGKEGWGARMRVFCMNYLYLLLLELNPRCTTVIIVFLKVNQTIFLFLFLSLFFFF